MNAPSQQNSLLCLASLSLLALSALFSACWFLVFFALIPLFFVARTANLQPTWVLWAIWAVGFIYFLIVLYPLSTLNTWWWTISNSWILEFRGLIFFGVCAGLALLCSFLSFGVPFFIFSKWRKRAETDSATKLIAIIIGFPILWIILEFIRVKIIFGLEWGIFGQPLAENLFFARWAADANMNASGIFGLSSSLALSFLVVAVNVCLYLIIENQFQEKTARQSAKIIGPGLILLALFGWLIFSNSAHNSMPKSAVQGKASAGLNIALVSPNIKTDDGGTKVGIDHILNLTNEAVGMSPDLIIFPENIFPLLVIDEKTLGPANALAKEIFNRLAKISAENPKTSFIIGLHSTRTNTAGGKNKNFNSVIVFEAGKIVSIYNKKNLMPLTERSFAFLEAVNIDPLSAGEGERVIKTQHGNFTPLICSELLISQNATAKTSPPTLALINLSNDNVFDSPRMATYNKKIAKIRAIEAGQPLIRANKGGFSGIFDQTGREIPEISLLPEQSSVANAEIFFAHLDIP